MHLEILVEDQSGEVLLAALLPKLLGDQTHGCTWRVHAYKGVGRVPRDLGRAGDPAKRILLDQLPRLLRGYGKTPGIDGVLVLLDADKRNCADFLAELESLAASSAAPARTLFRLAIEEIEAWYFGDRQALLSAYPSAKRGVLDDYVQDSACDTWECLAKAIYPGGVAAINRKGWPLPGQVKCDWAGRIGPLLDPQANLSPSFAKFRDGLRRLVGPTA